MTLRIGLIVILLLFMRSSSAGESEAASDPKADLLESHLKQARTIAPLVGRRRTEAGFEKLKAEISEKRKAWENRAEAGQETEALIAGITAEVLKNALSVAGDEKRTQAALKAGVGIDLLLALTAARNPDIQAARENWLASLRRFEQAAYLEDLVTQYRAFVRELDISVGPQVHKEMMEMTFPFPAALALKGQIVDAEANLAWLGYQGVLREKLNEMARAFFEVQYSARSSEILRDTRVLFVQMAESAEARLRSGQGDQAYLLLTQSEVAMLDTRLITRERQRTKAQAQANALIGLQPAVEWGELVQQDLSVPAWTLEEALKIGEAESQDLHMARQDAVLMALMVRMAETEVLPRGSIGYSQQALSMGADAGPTREGMASFPDKQGVDTSRASFGANAAYLDELRVRVREADRKLAAMNARTEFMVKEGHFNLDAARREQQTLAEIVVPKAEQAYEALKARYSSGAAPLRDFLEICRIKLERRLDLEAARRERNVMVSEFLSALGRSAAAPSRQRLEGGP